MGFVGDGRDIRGRFEKAERALRFLHISIVASDLHEELAGACPSKSAQALVRVFFSNLE